MRFDVGVALPSVVAAGGRRVFSRSKEMRLVKPWVLGLVSCLALSAQAHERQRPRVALLPLDLPAAKLASEQQALDDFWLGLVSRTKRVELAVPDDVRAELVRKFEGSCPDAGLRECLEWMAEHTATGYAVHVRLRKLSPRAWQLAATIGARNKAEVPQPAARAFVFVDRPELPLKAALERQLEEYVRGLSLEALPATLAADRPRAPPPTLLADERRTVPLQASVPKTHLVVTSSVQSTVSIDGAAVGDTPVATEALTPGRHTVSVTAPGHQPSSRELALTAGEKQTVSFELEKVPQPKPAPVAPPAKEGSRTPDLPRTFAVRTTQDLAVVFRRVEEEAVGRGGVSPARARGATSELGNKLVQEAGAGQTIDVYPAGMYWFIVRGAQAGESPAQLARELKAAHYNGDLEHLAGDPRPSTPATPVGPRPRPPGGGAL